MAVVALSLGGLRRKIEIAMLPDVVSLSASAECRHWSGRAVRWSSCTILLSCAYACRRWCGPQGGSPGLDPVSDIGWQRFGPTVPRRPALKC